MNAFRNTGGLWWLLRFMAVFTLCFVAAACGGGSHNSTTPTTPAPPKVVAFLGDSLTNGGFYAGASLEVRPVERMTSYAEGRWVGLNLAADGMRCVEHPKPPEDAYAYVFRFGMADQVKGSKREDVNACLRSSVKALKDAGKTVYVVGVINVQDPAQNSVLALWDADQKAIAESLNAFFIDVRSLGHISMNDDIHPDQAGSDKTSRLIADSID